MKTFQLRTLIVLLQAYLATAKVATLEVGGDVKISDDGKTIKYTDPHCEPSDSWTCDASRSCNGKKVWSLDADKDHAACCLPSQHLSGSPETEFLCCGKDHEVTGTEAVGYTCCPTGSVYDGKKCKKVCDNGKELKDGKCACPKGTVEKDDGTCKKKSCDPADCSSGLQTGKCYTFRASNGELLGRNSDKKYYAAPNSMDQRWGKFKFCKDEECKGGLPINPSDEFYIKDLHGDVKTGKNPGQWLDEQVDGGHISYTDDFEKAGEFSITKWPCGKYCLGGFKHGLGPACPGDHPAITFYTQDPQMCVPFELTEVPCDVKDDKNNCVWANGEDQCCDKMKCPKCP